MSEFVHSPDTIDDSEEPAEETVVDTPGTNPENRHASPTGDMVVRAAMRVNGLLERNNKARHDAVDWTIGKAEQAHERGKSALRSIGRGALKSLKTAGKVVAFVPLTAAGLTVAAGEAAISGTIAGANIVKSAGEAVADKAVDIHTNVTESVNRKIEDGKDRVNDFRDTLIGGSALAAAGISAPRDSFAIWKRNRTEAKVEKFMSRLERQDVHVDTRNKNRAERITNAEAAKIRKANRTAARELRRAA